MFLVKKPQLSKLAEAGASHSIPLSHGRDARIDTLRGLALIVMTVNHLQGRLHLLTYQTFGFVSAAEVFIFASGLVGGMVFTRLADRDGPTAVRKKAHWRAVLLYTYHVLTLWALVALGHIEKFEKAWRSWIPVFKDTLLLEAPAQASALGAALIYQPTYLDILPMYTVFLFSLPFVLSCLRRGRGLWILAASLAIWVFAQEGRTFHAFDSALRQANMRAPFFDIFAWQAMFWLGLVAGHRRQQGLRVRPPRWSFWPCLAICIVLALLRWDVISGQWVLEFFDLRAATNVTCLGWLRLLNFLFLANVVMQVGAWKPDWLTWRWPAFLGRHSLQVYTAHIAAVFLLAPWLKSIDKMAWHEEALRTLVVLGLLTLTAWCHARWQAGAGFSSRRRASA